LENCKSIYFLKKSIAKSMFFKKRYHKKYVF
jgi:hypothetical protein